MYEAESSALAAWSGIWGVLCVRRGPWRNRRWDHCKGVGTQTTKTLGKRFVKSAIDIKTPCFCALKTNEQRTRLRCWRNCLKITRRNLQIGL